VTKWRLGKLASGKREGCRPLAGSAGWSAQTKLESVKKKKQKKKKRNKYFANKRIFFGYLTMILRELWN
jgi:hypothetical protein